MNITNPEAPFEFLQKWYVRHCDGEWEHSNRIRIQTIDNPGWRVDINLADTDLVGKPHSALKIETDDNDWVSCWVEDEVFKIACGPTNLAEGLQRFAQWVSEYTSQP